jgi:hypothetical protein
VALTAESALKLISRAWGKQSGFVFFPWIDGDAEDKAQRIRGYNEGRAFKWPSERAEIIKHLEAHTDDDLYWCPSIFEKKVRQLQHAMDEHALWADLDTVNPEEIDEQYRPTVAWESSPGRYQALWLITGGDLQGASWPGNENQKLTYYLGADHSGWDTTQLLRIPGWDNHKPEYKDANNGNPVSGRLLWHNGRRYLPDDFSDLPEVAGADAGNLAQDVLEDQISAIDRLEVWGKVRLKCSKEVRELVSARGTGGEDRSDKLWQIERDLADAGCTVPEIVAIVRETVWNKFAGRADELKRLLTEAAKAIGERSEETEKQLEKDREEKPRPGNLFTMVKEAEPPVWLVKGILTQASCGFFAGEPKSFKSWSALDLVLSVATGAPFLNAFDVLQPGPVLYVQEEDPLPTLKDRLGKMVPHKTQDRVTAERDDDGELRLVWEPAEENDVVPRVSAIVREQFTVSDPGWQAWLDEVLNEGYVYTQDETSGIELPNEPYKLVVLDPLMMIAGDVDENRAQEMTEKIYRPLKVLAEKHQCAIQVVHHMRKGRDNDNGTRGGQKMLGSVANHAWSENSLYFTHGRLGVMLVETESKHAQSIRFEIRNLRKKSPTGQLTWEPEVNVLTEEEHGRANAGKSGNGATGNRSRKRNPAGRVGQGTRKMVARRLGMSPDATQAEVRQRWEDQGGTWGIFDFSGNDPAVEFDVDDLEPADQPERKSPGRKADPDPAAFKALRKLTARKPRAYSTHEVKDEMAKELNQKPTQTIYLRAYQQLKRLYDEDKITRVEKNWLMMDVDPDALDDAEIEELV